MPDDHTTTAAVLTATGRLVPVPCPKCVGALARRSHREGLTEKLLSLVYVYPFRCQLCGHRFLSLQWGIRYQRVSLDHREYHRHPIEIPVLLSGHHGDARGRTADLSLGGCTFITARPCRDISQLNVRLEVPSESHPLTVEAAAVRSVQGRRIGMEFLHAKPEEKARIGRLIEATWRGTAPGGDERRTNPEPTRTQAAWQFSHDRLSRDPDQS